MNQGSRGWAVAVAGVAIAGSLSGPGSAGADELALAITAGRVTLTATGVPLGDVLAEWSRVGRTRFEGVGELGEAPVTLHLEGVAEREALRLLLRPAAGFLAAPRGPGGSGASRYDRVKIRAARRAPQAAPAAPRPPRPVRETPGLSAGDQRERLLRLLRPSPVAEPADEPRAPAQLGGAAYAPTTPRPGMVADPEPLDPR